MYRKTAIAICAICGKEKEMRDLGHTHFLEGSFYLLPIGWEGHKEKNKACFCEECKNKTAAILWDK